MTFHFASPGWLLLLVPLILVVRQMQREPGAALKYSSLRLLAGLGRTGRTNRRQLLVFLRAAALILLIVALARPQTGRKLTEVISEGVDIVLAIDTSRSMEATDFVLKGKPASRLDVVKQVVREFVRNQSGNRVGLVVFGSEAFTQCPLTLDYGVLDSFVARLETGMAGDATAIGSALSVASARLKDLPAKSKVIILLTDGASNAGPVGPLDAAEAARALGIKVYTVGIGTEGYAPIPRHTILGTFYDSVKVEFDEATLRQIAETTAGRYFFATDTDTLENIYDTIDKLEKTEKKVKEHMDFHERFVPFSVAGLVLLLLEIVLANTWLRKLP